MATESKRTVLIVEDDDVISDALNGVLCDDHDVVCVDSLTRARRLLKEARFDAVVLDLLLSDSEHGESLLHELATAREPGPAIIVVSASKMAPTIARAYGVPVLVKPFDVDELLTTLASAIEEERRPRRRV